MPANAPVFGQFDQDPRVHFDKTAGTWQYEDEDDGVEYEWNGKSWIPVVCWLAFVPNTTTSLTTLQLDEEAFKAQQAAYSVAGVDENV